jgi:hypothetical protein
LKLFRYTVFVAALVGSVAALAQGPRRDGKWEVTMQMEMPGLPVQMPPTTSTQCITPEQAANPQQSVPQTGRGRAGDCKVSDYKVEGPKVTWTMKCEGTEPMSGTGEMVYGADSYKGAIKINASGRSMTMNLSGKRVGDCTGQ